MQTRIILVGGFLGAGKTTLLWHTARRLAQQGTQAGIITNDQGHNLVDTALLGKHYAVTEVSGGCFCCNFPDLMISIQQLQNQVEPEIILAEPVGSCTDIMATVIRPLRKYYNKQFSIAPFTVLVDPLRDEARFEANVQYLYNQQLAEADLILLNKCDLLTADEIQDELSVLRAEYPQAQVLAVSSRTGEGVETWLDLVLSEESSGHHILDVDYSLYAEAEAALGWLNAQGSVQPETGPLQWAETLLREIEKSCSSQDIRIAHVKLHLQIGDTGHKASITQTGSSIVWNTPPPNQPTSNLNFILNARVNASPSSLEQIVRDAITTATPSKVNRIQLHHFECFSPRPPEPTYHIGIKEM
jgi:G3E family GTPase